MSTEIKVPAGHPRVQYTADGTQRTFTYNFPIFQASDLQVYVDAARQTTGYTVGGPGQTAGGSVTFAAAPAAGRLVTLRRHVEVERLTDFLESGPLSALALNTEFDRLTAVLQQVAEDQGAMLHYAATDLPASSELPGRSLRANRLLTFDSAGNPSVALPADTDRQIVYSPVGAGAVERPVRDKLSDMISVKDFGAVGDGVTDDTVAFQSALTAVRSVYVPAGTYVLGSTLTVGEGQTLGGAGQATVLRGSRTDFDLIHLPAGYATVRDLRLEQGAAGVRLFGRDGPCVQNSLLDLTIWEATDGLVLDGYTRPDWPCYWNNIGRVLVAKPRRHGVWMTRSGAGDTPNANRFHMLRVYSLGAALSGSGIYVEYGRYNNAFVDCEVNLHPTGHSCVRLGALANKNLFVNLYCESLGGLANLLLEAGSEETAVVNLFSASAGPAIEDHSGGRYTAFNAGYPLKNRMGPSRVSDLTVGALRFDTVFHDPATGGLFEPDLSSSVYLVSGYNGAVEVRLPDAAAGIGHAVTIKKTDASGNPVTVTAAAGTGPEGRQVVLANRYDFVTVVSNGAGWWIVGGNNLPGNAGYHDQPGVFEPSLNQDLYLVSAYQGAVEVRLPVPSAAHAVGRQVCFKKSDGSTRPVTVTTAVGTGPDGEAIRLTAYGHAVTVFSNGNGWHIVARNP